MNIRLATADDASKWLELFRATFGEQYPARTVYSESWIAEQLIPLSGHETWVSESSSRLESSVSFLTPSSKVAAGPIINLGRNLHRSESIVNGSAETLLNAINAISTQRFQSVVTRIQAHGNSQQILYENAGYMCVGFQPLKHQLQNRVGMLFYMRPEADWVRSNPRSVVSQAFAEVAEMATIVLSRLRLPTPRIIADDIIGYPLQTDLTITSSTFEGFEESREQSRNSNPPIEIFSPFNLGHGLMRISSPQPCRALLCVDHGRTVGGLLFRFDEMDKCARIVDAFATDGMSMGAMLARTLKLAEDHLGAVYTEVDLLSTASRLLKTTEQLGFVPVAYLPGFGGRKDARVDTVKLAKFNMPYSAETSGLTRHAHGVVEIVDRCFDNQRMGLATIKLLRPLAMFAGLGDGEMRKILRLFTQRFYRVGEPVFAKGDNGNEAYIVLRGQIDILLEPNSKPVASLSNGKIFGELAFLDGGPRSTFAIAAQPSILLVVQQAAFLELTRREPSLGMVVMRNIAVDLTGKLRAADVAIATHRSG